MPEDGTLTPIGHESTRGRTPRNFTIDAAGRFLYAANQDTDTVVTFAIDPETGLLSYRSTAEAPSPVCLQIVAPRSDTHCWPRFSAAIRQNADRAGSG